MSFKPPLEARMYIQTLRSRTPTYLFLCSGGTRCLVKAYRPTETRRPISAFIASRLARRLGIPTPEWTTVTIADTLLTGTPEIANLLRSPTGDTVRSYPASYYAGAAHQSKLMDFLPKAYLESLTNLNDFLHLFALDLWCSHSGSLQAVFERATVAAGYRATFLGRDSTFGGGTLCFRDSPLNGIYDRREVYAHVTGWESFEPFLTNLIEISPDSIWSAIENLPFEWNVRYAADLHLLVNGLVSRRSLIRHLIAQSKSEVPCLFPAWTRKTFVPPLRGWNGEPAFGNRQKAYP